MFRKLLFLILLLFSFLSYSQVQEQELFKLGENDIKTEPEGDRIEVVSASRSEKLRDDLPVTVYVVSREEILQNGYTSLVDVLKDIPGIKVSQPGSGMEGETFLMDGLFGNYYCKINIIRGSIFINPAFVITNVVDQPVCRILIKPVL